MTREEIIKEFEKDNINFDSGEADYIDDVFTLVLDLVYRLVNNKSKLCSCSSNDYYVEEYKDVTKYYCSNCHSSLK